MLSIKLITAGAEDYYLNLAADDYYLSGGEPPGCWVGGACDSFRLSGTAVPEEFRRIFRGYHPTTNQPLVQNAGKSTRQAGWDLTFSAPKSVSVIWSQAPPAMRQRIREIHHEALQATIAFAELAFGRSRVGQAGSGGLVSAKLIAAVFDPALHSHALLMNVGVDAEGKTRSIVSRPIFRNKMLLGAMYRANLAHLLEQDFGFRAERKGNVFEVRGVPKAVTEAHSTRRKEVLAQLNKTGRSGGKAAAIAALETRRAKEKVPPRSELFERWQEQNESLGFTTESLMDLVHVESRDSAKLIPHVLRIATEILTKNKPHFTAHDFLREALYVAPVFGVLPDDLVPAVEKYLEDEKSIVPIPTLSGEVRYTTVSILEAEQAMLQTLEALRERKGRQVTGAVLEKVFRKSPTLAADQRAAAKHLTQAESAVRIVRGLAGTGKTSMLKACCQIWNTAKFDVIGAAPTGAAAQVLEDETGIPSDTIHMTLGDFDTKFGFKVKHHVKQFVRAARRRKTYRLTNPKPVKITPKTILVVDEASMVNTRHFRMLMDLVKKGGGTIVFVGDPAQLPAVKGSSPFHSISNRTGFAELTEIKRQEESWARTASHFLANKQAGRALAMYAERSLVRVRDNPFAALDQLVLDWTEYGLTTPHRAAILTLTNDLAHEANERCQKKRLEIGCLNHTISATITDQHNEITTYTSKVHPGDRVLFTNTTRKHGVFNGNLGTVVAFGRFKRSIIVDLDNGTRVNVPLNFKHIRLGYAMTTHKAQGSTFDEVFVLLGGRTQNLPISYVQGTRSRLSTRFYAEKAVLDEYLEDVEDSPLAAQMEREVDLSLASDLFVAPTDSDRDRAALIEKLLSHWKKNAAANLRGTAIITNSDDEAKRINGRCHDILYAMAQTEWTERMRRPGLVPTATAGETTLVAGDRIRFTAPSYRHRLLPNELATVESISPKDQTIDVKLDRGLDVTLPLDNLPPLTHAYALTNEQANDQHLELDNAYLLDPKPINFLPDEIPSTRIDRFNYTEPAYSTPTVFAPDPVPIPTTNNQSTWEAKYIHTFNQNQYAAAQTEVHRRVYQANQPVQNHYQQQGYSQNIYVPAQQQATSWG